MEYTKEPLDDDRGAIFDIKDSQFQSIIVCVDDYTKELVVYVQFNRQHQRMPYSLEEGVGLKNLFELGPAKRQALTTNALLMASVSPAVPLQVDFKADATSKIETILDMLIKDKAIVEDIMGEVKALRGRGAGG